MKKTKNNIHSIFFKCLPKQLQNHLQILDNLDLPVHDKCSFSEQLDALKGQADTSLTQAITLIDRRFTARDFPILSLENAVEKYRELFRPIPIPRPGFDYDFTLPEDIRERPSVCSTYEDTFDDPAAAACACRSFSEAIRQGFTEFQAIIIGMQAGNRFRDTGECL